jgi:hypothetical protein
MLKRKTPLRIIKSEYLGHLGFFQDEFGCCLIKRLKKTFLLCSKEN